MKIQKSYSKTNFTSGIKIMQKADLALENLANAKFVGAPYTANQIVRAQKAFTSEVATCCAGGFIVQKEGEKTFDVIFLHLIPKKHFDSSGKEVKSSNIAEIHKKILDLLGKDKIVQAFLFGGKKGPQKALLPELIESQKLFKKMENYIKRVWKIPYSKIKGFPLGKNAQGILLYNGETNKWKLAATDLKRFTDIFNYFDDVVIAPCDHFTA